jgi:uncharacterized LabA/DUF88 family protein
LQKLVNFYIDGFNFYFGLKSKNWQKYYWLDVVKFCESFIKPNQTLNSVLYFTAAPKDQGKKDRQDLFFSANKTDSRFKLVFGKYIPKTLQFGKRTYTTFEEKQTDVNIAVEMLRNVFQKKVDISILVSADSDILPAINLIREIDPNHKVFCYFPPNRYSTDLAQNADAIIKLSRYEQRFKKALLPDKITLPNGYIIKRPKKWQ